MVHGYRFGVELSRSELHLYLEQIQEYILCIKNKGDGIRIEWVEKKKKNESKTAYLRVITGSGSDLREKTKSYP